MTQSEFVDRMARNFNMTIGSWSFDTHAENCLRQPKSCLLIIRRLTLKDGRPWNVEENLVRCWSLSRHYHHYALNFNWGYWTTLSEQDHINCSHHWFNLEGGTLRKVRTRDHRLVGAFWNARQVFRGLEKLGKFEEARMFQRIMDPMWRKQ